MSVEHFRHTLNPRHFIGMIRCTFRYIQWHNASTPSTWWRHQMETFPALLALCAGNSPVPGEFLSQSPVTRSCDVFFHLRLNKRLSKQSWGWWFETPSRSLWRHCNVSPDLMLTDIGRRQGPLLLTQIYFDLNVHMPITYPVPNLNGGIVE